MEAPLQLYKSGSTATPIAGTYGVDGFSYADYAYGFAGGPDPSPELAGRLKYIVYNEMRRSDPAITGLLAMTKLPIRQAVWDLTPASEDGEDLLRTDILARQFGLKGEDSHLDHSWDEQLAQALLMLDWGAMFEEMIWGEPEDWTLEDRDVFVKPLLRLAPRSPSSVAKIGQDPARGILTGITQDLPGARPIPGEKLTWHVLDREGANWYGTSFLRPVHGAWRLKRSLLIASAIAWDRFASGIPVVRHPQTPAGQERAEAIGRDVRTHERAYVAMPYGDEWDFKIETTGGISDPTPILRLYDEQIAIRGLQQFSVLGRTGSGSRAVADVQIEPFYAGLNAIAGEIASTKMKQVFRRFFDVNFGPQYPLPKLTFSKLSRRPIEILAAALANLSSAGFTFSDRETQDDVRAMLELPDLPDEVKQAAALAEAAGLGIEQQSPSALVPREGAGLGFAPKGLPSERA